MDFLRLFQHLLPDGRAWRTTIDKRMRQFFAGLAELPADVRGAADSVWGDLLPGTTDELNRWEAQFGLPGNVTGEAERRARLAGTWLSLVGGQSPRYVQDTLRASGFDVYVHEWWVPNAHPLFAAYCDGVGAEAGEPGIECTLATVEARDPLSVLAPDNITPVLGRGYPLVNIIVDASPLIIASCGEAAAECGEAAALAGNFFEVLYTQKRYETPTDPARWPYVLYIGGQNFGDVAQIPTARRSEFEELCLKTCPAQQWLGVLTEYV